MSNKKPDYSRLVAKILLRCWTLFMILFLTGILLVEKDKEKEYKVPTGKFERKGELSKEKQEEYLKKLDLRLSFENPGKCSVVCFDVNEKGLIALGHDDGKIGIYNSKGIYIHGYDFHLYGAFYVEWQGEDLWLYDIRGDIGVLVDRHAQCKDIIRIFEGYGERSHWKELQYTARKSEGKIYVLCDKAFGRYYKLLEIDSNGEHKEIYDASILPVIENMDILLVDLLLIIFFVELRRIKWK